MAFSILFSILDPRRLSSPLAAAVRRAARSGVRIIAFAIEHVNGIAAPLDAAMIFPSALAYFVASS
jgi:hypothetical protein